MALLRVIFLCLKLTLFIILDIIYEIEMIKKGNIMATLSSYEQDRINDLIYDYSESKQNKIEKLLKINVLKVVDGTQHSFPQKTFQYRYIHVWYLLENGESIGFNESPRSGFTIVIAGKRATESYISKNLKKLIK